MIKANRIRSAVIASVVSLPMLVTVGCSTGKAPTQSPGTNPIVNGSFTWYVDAKNGSTFGDGTTPGTAFITVQQAANVALPGDTVQLADGTYQNSGDATLNIAKGGKPDAWITYTAASGAHPVITGTNTYDIVRIQPTANYVALKNLTIMGNNDDITLAEALADASAPQNFPKVNGNCLNILGYDKTTGAVGGHINILNNVVFNCSGVGIGSNADYLTISGNTVYNSAWYNAYGESGISSGATYDSNPSDTTTPYRVIITNNIIYANQEFVPWISVGYISDGEGIIIDSNTNSQYDASVPYPPYSGRTLIANNVIYANGSSAVEVYESAHVDVFNNSTYGNDISPAEPGRGEIAVGDIYQGRDTTDVKVVNNIMYGTLNSVLFELGSPCATCVIDYNLYYGGTNKIAAGSNAGAHSLYVDPLYVDPANATLASVNLKLKTGSPAIGAGTSALVPTTDINGNPRPLSPGAAVSMGAYSQ